MLAGNAFDCVTLNCFNINLSDCIFLGAVVQQSELRYLRDFPVLVSAREWSKGSYPCFGPIVLTGLCWSWSI